MSPITPMTVADIFLKKYGSGHAQETCARNLHLYKFLELCHPY